MTKIFFFTFFGTQYDDVCRPVDFLVLAHWMTDRTIFIINGLALRFFLKARKKRDFNERREHTFLLT